MRCWLVAQEHQKARATLISWRKRERGWNKTSLPPLAVFRMGVPLRWRQHLCRQRTSTMFINEGKGLLRSLRCCVGGHHSSCSPSERKCIKSTFASQFFFWQARGGVKGCRNPSRPRKVRPDVISSPAQQDMRQLVQVVKGKGVRGLWERDEERETDWRKEGRGLLEAKDPDFRR